MVKIIAAKKANDKPKKPHPDFPLFPHASNRWCKKIKGKAYYFGKVSTDPQGKAAIQDWLARKDGIFAGQDDSKKSLTPATDIIAVKDICNAFVSHKKGLLESGELTERSFKEYFATCERLVKAFGRLRLVADLVGDDFRRLRASIAKQWGPIRLANEIQRVRSVFKYGYESGLIDQPVRIGVDFKKPSAKVLRKNRAKSGPKMFEASELRALLATAGPNMKAMILLAANGGLGNSDVAGLPFAAVNLKTRWLTYPRPKTGIERRIPLWLETISAIKAVKKQRCQPKDVAHKALIFIGPRGENYLAANGYRVAGEFARALKTAKIKPRRGFYAIRHTFQTVAEGVRDLSAVQSIMGHAASSGDMSAQYRERVDDDRLLDVTEHVHKWLFGESETK
ncbi:MAG: tyrosine-type recombinase/integrase [Thermoguttaceae bacterium]